MPYILAWVEYSAALIGDHLENASAHLRLIVGHHVTSSHDPVVREVSVFFLERSRQRIFSWK